MARTKFRLKEDKEALTSSQRRFPLGPQYRMCIGRFYWDRDRKYPSPWMTFDNRTQFTQFMKYLRSVAGRRVPYDYEYVNNWTAEMFIRDFEAGRKFNDD